MVSWRGSRPQGIVSIQPWVDRPVPDGGVFLLLVCGGAVTHRQGIAHQIVPAAVRTSGTCFGRGGQITHMSFPRSRSALALLAPALFLSITGCKKYDDGPLISLTPREERVANTWVIEKAIEDGQDVTSEYDHYVLTLTTDHSATLDAEYDFFGTLITTETNGTWAFENDESNLALDFEDNVADGTYQILRLTEPQLWLRKVGDDLELRLKEQ